MATTHTVMGMHAHCAGVILIPRCIDETGTMCLRRRAVLSAKATVPASSNLAWPAPLNRFANRHGRLQEMRLSRNLVGRPPREVQWLFVIGAHKPAVAPSPCDH